MEELTSFFIHDIIDKDIENALIEHFSASHDADSAFFLAKQFGIDASHIPITAEDSAIRADLENLYPLHHILL